MKRRKQRKPRNELVVAMILTRKGGVMRDRRDRRTDNPKNNDWN